MFSVVLRQTMRGDVEACSNRDMQHATIRLTPTRAMSFYSSPAPCAAWRMIISRKMRR
jgi:hypothetical protein